MTIMVFDSGLGGLSILREVRAVLPSSDIVYLADDAAFPYGGWDQEKLIVRILDVISTAIGKVKPDLVILACNTASTLALDELRSRFDIPFVGTVPAIKPAAEQTSSCLISVLATQGTVKRQYTRNLIAEFADKVHVRLVGSESLAKIAEAHLTGGQVDLDLVHRQILPCFVELDGARTDIIVLACTHYPFLINQFRKVAPWPVDWLDPAEPIARQAKRLLTKENPDETSLASANQIDIAQFTSGSPDKASIRLVSGFGLQVN
ncbi:MAG: glutamate racemase [Hyphomicrobiales bacterium]|nr:glutamate racemase [Hyphomicrobiales bacterium]